jgi:hypothetical protein
VEDTALKDNYKFKNTPGHYYTFTDGYDKDTSKKYVEGETYYTYDEKADSRYITLSSQEDKTPFSIGTDSSI